MSHQKGGLVLSPSWQGFSGMGVAMIHKRNQGLRVAHVRHWRAFPASLLNVSERLGERWGDDCQNTVAELPSVIFRRSSWLSKKIMPRSVSVSYRRVTSVSKPVQL